MFFVWLALYGTVMLVAQRYAALSPWVMPGALLVVVIGLVFLAGAHDVIALFRLPGSTHWKMQLGFVPYLSMVGYNLFRFGIHIPAVPYLCQLLLAAVMEEIVFRGVLLRWLRTHLPRGGILCCAILFAAAHLLNLESGMGLDFVVPQAIYALAVGYALSGITVTCGSILPCVVIHFLLNATAGQMLWTDPVFWLIAALYFACGVRSIHLFK